MQMANHNAEGPSKMQDSRSLFPLGLVGDVAAFIYDSAPYPDADVALLAALVFIAAICGRAYKVENLGLNLYAVLLALPGTGKDCAFSGINALKEAIWIYLQANGLNDYQTIATCGIPPSHVSLHREIAGDGQNAKFRSADRRDEKAKIKEPMYTANLSLLGLWDEATSFIQTILDYTNLVSPLKDMRALLLTLFSDSGESKTLQGKPYADKSNNIPDAIAPAFSFIAASQPPAFFKVVSVDNITDGLFPRLVMLEVANTRPDYNSKRIRVPSNELIAKIVELIIISSKIEWDVAIQGREHFRQVAFASDAKREIDEYHKRNDYIINKHLQNKDGVLSALHSRVTELTKRIAGLLAIGQDFANPIIEVSDIDKAQAIVERGNGIIRARVRTGEMHGDDLDQRALKRLRKELRDFVRDRANNPEWDDSYKARYRTKQAVWELPVDVVSISYLRKECYKNEPFQRNKYAAQLFDRALRTLVEDGAIGINNDRIVATLKANFPNECGQIDSAIQTGQTHSRFAAYAIVTDAEQLGDC